MQRKPHFRGDGLSPLGPEKISMSKAGGSIEWSTAARRSARPTRYENREGWAGHSVSGQMLGSISRSTAAHGVHGPPFTIIELGVGRLSTGSRP